MLALRRGRLPLVLRDSSRSPMQTSRLFRFGSVLARPLSEFFGATSSLLGCLLCPSPQLFRPPLPLPARLSPWARRIQQTQDGANSRPKQDA